MNGNKSFRPKTGLPCSHFARVPRPTETKIVSEYDPELKYQNITEIPERNIKIIGKHIQMSKWLMDNANAFLI